MHSTALVAPCKWLAGSLRKELRPSIHFAGDGTPNQPITTMTKLEMKGSWNDIKGKLKQKYAQLTDDDLLFEEGKEDELLGRLEKKVGRSKEEIRQAIADL